MERGREEEGHWGGKNRVDERMRDRDGTQTGREDDDSEGHSLLPTVHTPSQNWTTYKARTVVVGLGRSHVWYNRWCPGSRERLEPISGCRTSDVSKMNQEQQYRTPLTASSPKDPSPPSSKYSTKSYILIPS
jgi:hypothetical protein